MTGAKRMAGSAGMYAHLRQAIVSGEITPGTKLAETDLQTTYGLARGTVRTVIRQLTEEGLLEARHGSGTYVLAPEMLVTYQPTGAGTPPAEHYFASIRAQGMVPSQITTVEWVTPPGDVASLLSIAGGDRCILRHCLRSAAPAVAPERGQPISTEDTWYPAWVVARVPELAEPADITPGTTWHMAQRGMIQAAYADELTARPPTAEERDQLAMGHRSLSLLIMRRTGYDADGRPVRLTEAKLVGTRNRVGYQLGDVSLIPSDAGA